MSELDIVQIKNALLMQRQEIFERHKRHEAGWQSLSQRDIEMEEEAQKADLTVLFDQLNGLERGEIENIDRALHKIAAASYGACERCRKAIATKRLQALPATRLCLGCARKNEQETKRTSKPPGKAAPWNDLQHTDHLEELVYDGEELAGNLLRMENEAPAPETSEADEFSGSRPPWLERVEEE